MMLHTLWLDRGGQFYVVSLSPLTGGMGLVGGATLSRCFYECSVMAIATSHLWFGFCLLHSPLECRVVAGICYTLLLFVGGLKGALGPLGCVWKNQ